MNPRSYTPRERERVVDVECMRGYFLVKFRDLFGLGLSHSYAMWPGKDLDVIAISECFRDSTVYTFNGNNYDMPMITLALTGVDTHALKEASDAIIMGGIKWWDFYNAYGICTPYDFDHVDLFEVAPGVGISLKMYAGRNHSAKMQDLPYDPAEEISPFKRVVIDDYCGNDLDVTADLKNSVQQRLDLRVILSDQYGVDVRSKSDAQIAEAIIKAKLSFKPPKRFVPHGFSFYYQPPAAIRFITPQLQQVFDLICKTPFIVEDKEQARHIFGLSDEDERDAVFGPDGEKISTGVKLPACIKALAIKIGSSTYQMGIGGLHSQEEKTFHYTLPGKWSISDHDVASYYPSLILALGMFPEQLTAEFLKIYREIYDTRQFEKKEAERLATLAKGYLNQASEILDGLVRAGKMSKTVADGLKIVLNGTFGKLFSKHSILFAPELGIQVTVTGQLYLLMLIEQLEFQGISVVSANTDGIVLKTPHGMEGIRDAIIAQWEKITQLQTEATFYTAIYSRDVNNYIAFKRDGSHKGKGVFADSGVLNNKHPDRDICGEAVIAYLKSGTPLEQTVRACTDVRKLIVIRRVKGGGYFFAQEFPEVAVAKKRYASLKGKLQRLVKKHMGPTNLGIPPEAVPVEMEMEAMAREIEKLKAHRASQGFYLGKAVRWYYGTSPEAHIATASGSQVANSEGAVPAMTLPTSMPPDVDFGRYVQEARNMLTSMGLR